MARPRGASLASIVDLARDLARRLRDDGHHGRVDVYGRDVVVTIDGASPAKVRRIAAPIVADLRAARRSEAARRGWATRREAAAALRRSEAQRESRARREAEAAATDGPRAKLEALAKAVAEWLDQEVAPRLSGKVLIVPPRTQRGGAETWGDIKIAFDRPIPTRASEALLSMALREVARQGYNLGGGAVVQTRKRSAPDDTPYQERTICHSSDSTVAAVLEAEARHGVTTLADLPLDPDDIDDVEAYDDTVAGADADWDEFESMDGEAPDGDEDVYGVSNGGTVSVRIA